MGGVFCRDYGLFAVLKVKVVVFGMAFVRVGSVKSRIATVAGCYRGVKGEESSFWYVG